MVTLDSGLIGVFGALVGGVLGLAGAVVAKLLDARQQQRHLDRARAKEERQRVEEAIEAVELLGSRLSPYRVLLTVNRGLSTDVALGEEAQALQVDGREVRRLIIRARLGHSSSTMQHLLNELHDSVLAGIREMADFMARAMIQLDAKKPVGVPPGSLRGRTRELRCLIEAITDALDGRPPSEVPEAVPMQEEWRDNIDRLASLSPAFASVHAYEQVEAAFQRMVQDQTGQKVDVDGLPEALEAAGLLDEDERLSLLRLQFRRDEIDADETQANRVFAQKYARDLLKLWKAAHDRCERSAARPLP